MAIGRPQLGDASQLRGCGRDVERGQVVVPGRLAGQRVLAHHRLGADEPQPIVLEPCRLEALFQTLFLDLCTVRGEEHLVPRLQHGGVVVAAAAGADVVADVP